VRTFTVYRRGTMPGTHGPQHANAPDEPQFEGVVFSGGKVAVHWLTACPSVSVWDSLDDMLAIHGHPEYGSEIVWHDRTIICIDHDKRTAWLEDLPSARQSVEEANQ